MGRLYTHPFLDFGLNHMSYFRQCNVSRQDENRCSKCVCAVSMPPLVTAITEKSFLQVAVACPTWASELKIRVD